MSATRPATVGTGIGFLGALIPLVGTILLGVVPFELMELEARNAYIDRWSRPIMTVGVWVQVYGVSFLAAAGGYLLTRHKYSPREIAGGYGVGALVFAVGIVLVGIWSRYVLSDQLGLMNTPVWHVFEVGRFAIQIGISSAVGVLCAMAVAWLFKK